MDCKKCKWANVSSGDTVLFMNNGTVISQHGKNNVMCLCTIPKTTNIDMTSGEMEITCSAYEERPTVDQNYYLQEMKEK